MKLSSRVLVTVADLRAALAELNPQLRVITSNAPFTGVMLVETGGAIEIRSPAPGATKAMKAKAS